jgi:hypothetical protein
MTALDGYFEGPHKEIDWVCTDDDIWEHVTIEEDG